MSTQSPAGTIIQFTQTEDEGDYTVTLDGRVVISDLRPDWLNIADAALDPLWEALGVKVEFVQPKMEGE